MAVSALCDLSKSEVVCGKISKLNGAVLILGKVAGSKAENPTVAEKAEMTLQNLDRCEKNAVQMAENGRLEPLLNLLIEGSSPSLLLIYGSLQIFGYLLLISFLNHDTCPHLKLIRFSRKAAANGIIS